MAIISISPSTVVLLSRGLSARVALPRSIEMLSATLVVLAAKSVKVSSPKKAMKKENE